MKEWRRTDRARAARPGGSSLPRHVWWELGALGALTFAIRLIDLGHPPFVDELHHLLAAQSLLEHGTLHIHDGEPYTRSLLFTYLVAGFMSVLGDSLVVARLPAVLAGAALVCLLFFWLRVEANRVAAWAGGLLLAFAPVSIYLSQWVRFYTLHALLLWMGLFGLYWLLTRERTTRWDALLLGGLSAASIILAYHFQVTTAVAVAGLALFGVLVTGPRAVSAAMARIHWGWLLSAAGALVLVLGAGALLAGAPGWVLAHLQVVDTWALEHADNPRYYHWLMQDQYGFLWALLPVAVLVGFAYRWRPTLLLTLVLGGALLLHSLAAWKAERYIFYAMPAFFGLWGLATGSFLPWLWRSMRRRLRLLFGRTGPGWAADAMGAAVLFVALTIAIAGVTSYTYTRQIFLTGAGDWAPPPEHLGETYRGHADWAAAQERLGELKASADVLVAQSDLKAVYYLGDLDFVLYAGFLSGPRGEYDEFSPWTQVGRPLISTPQSIARIRSCFSDGLVIAEEHVWGWSGGVPRETAEWIEEHASPVDLPGGTGLLAYSWDDRSEWEPETPPHCDELREIRDQAPVPADP